MVSLSEILSKASRRFKPYKRYGIESGKLNITQLEFRTGCVARYVNVMHVVELNLHRWWELFGKIIPKSRAQEQFKYYSTITKYIRGANDPRMVY